MILVLLLQVYRSMFDKLMAPQHENVVNCKRSHQADVERNSWFRLDHLRRHHDKQWTLLWYARRQYNKGDLHDILWVLVRTNWSRGVQELRGCPRPTSIPYVEGRQAVLERECHSLIPSDSIVFSQQCREVLEHSQRLLRERASALRWLHDSRADAVDDWAHHCNAPGRQIYEFCEW